MTFFLLYVLTFTSFANGKLINENCILDRINAVYNDKRTIIYVFNKNIDDVYYKTENTKMLLNVNEEIALSNNIVLTNYENFLITVKDGCDLKSLLEKLIKSVFWNTVSSPHGKFLIFLHNITTCKQYNFDYLWQYQITKLLFISIMDDCQVYTYNTYLKQFRLYTEPLNSRIFRNFHIFANKEIKFNVNIGLLTHIFAYPYIISNSTNSNGLLINPLILWANKNNISLHYQAFNRDYVHRITSKETAEKFLYMFDNRTLDIVTAWTSLSNVKSNFSSTDIFRMENRMWVIPKRKIIPNYKTIARMFSTTSWMLFALVLLSSCFVWYFLSDTNDITYIILSLLELYFGGNIIIPRRYLPRIWIILYLFFVLNLNYIFLSKLSSIITIPQYEPKIRNMNDLLESRHIPYVYETSIYNIQSVNEIMIGRFMNKYKTYKRAITYPTRYVLDHENLALLSYKGHAETTYYRRHVETFEDTFFLPVQFCFLLRKGSIYTESINDIIATIHSNGMEKKWLSYYQQIKFLNTEMKEIVKIRILHIRFIFVILISGQLMGFITFLIELIYAIWWIKLKRRIKRIYAKISKRR